MDDHERPTQNPPFDPQAFARANAFSRPPIAGLPSARQDEDLSGRDRDEMRREEITLTDEVELERARMASMTGRETFRSPSTTGALSMANAAARSAPEVDLNQVSYSERELAGGFGAPEITQRIIEDPAAEMHERFALGDYSGALELAEIVLSEDEKNLDAAECSETCRSVLENMYAARVGPLIGVPVVVVPNAQVRWLSMDHRAGFVLSLIDGTSSLETILDLCGMSRLDALHILHDLVQQKIVVVK
jgi:hypothetical protein